MYNFVKGFKSIPPPSLSPPEVADPSDFFFSTAMIPAFFAWVEEVMEDLEDLKWFEGRVLVDVLERDLGGIWIDEVVLVS